MSFEDRDYMAAGPRRAPSLTGIIIAVNVGVFFLWQIQGAWEFLGAHAMVSALGVLDFGRVHTLLTAAFSHRDPWHLIFNMLFFWWFGRELEDWYGRARFAVLFLFAALLASVAHVALQLALAQPWIPALGASGAVMGFMVVYALLFPDNQMLIWGVIPVKMRWLVPIYIAVDLLGVVNPGDGIGHAAHLGGALAGLVFYVWDPHILFDGTISFWSRVKTIFGPRRMRPGLRTRSQAELRDNRLDPDASRADLLLEKISQQGMGALTDDERRFLEEYSKRLK